MPPETSAAPSAAAPAEVSFDDAVALLADDTPQEEQPKAKPPAKAATPTDDVDPNLIDPDEVEPTEEEEVEEKAEAAPAAEDLTDDAVIALGDGKTATLADLKQAHASFEESKVATTRALQEVASERSNLHTLGTNMATALENVSQYLVERLPAEPDPQLAYTDPQLHYQMTIARNNAIAELQDMLSVAQGSKQAVDMLTDADFKALKAEEDGKWVSTMPALKDPKRFAAADAKSKAHAKAQGFTDQEVDTTADHRLRKVFFQSARYEEIMANAGKAKGKVENASPMAPPKARSQHPNSQRALENVNAKKVLAKSGRLEDAMKIDFQ